MQIPKGRPLMGQPMLIRRQEGKSDAPALIIAPAAEPWPGLCSPWGRCDDSVSFQRRAVIGQPDRGRGRLTQKLPGDSTGGVEPFVNRGGCSGARPACLWF